MNAQHGNILDSQVNKQTKRSVEDWQASILGGNPNKNEQFESAPIGNKSNNSDNNNSIDQSFSHPTSDRNIVVDSNNNINNNTNNNINNNTNQNIPNSNNLVFNSPYINSYRHSPNIGTIAETRETDSIGTNEFNNSSNNNSSNRMNIKQGKQENDGNSSNENSSNNLNENELNNNKNNNDANENTNDLIDENGDVFVTNPLIEVEEDPELMKDCLQRLKHLNILHENHLITQDDYETRKSQIVDELTGTSTSSYLSRKHSKYRSTGTAKSHRLSTNTLERLPYHSPHQTPNQSHQSPHHMGSKPPSSNSGNKKLQLEVTPHPPPDWKNIRAERGIKYHYDHGTEKWNKIHCKVKIDETPFDKGGLRYVFHLQDLSCPQEKWVAKMSQDMRDNTKREIYFNDVRMQAIARYFCHGENGYNSYNPPKKVDFLEAYVLQLTQREGFPVCHVEKYIEGDYVKHNNNVGWVSDDARNTPHAFAHFTYEASKHKLLVCDIQGVNDVYTDPQVHSSENQKAFGRGNLGQKGFDNFLRTHQCNPICSYFKLHNINALPIQVAGTLPAQTQIMYNQVATIAIDFQNQANVPLLQDEGFPELKHEDTCCRKCVLL